jgi:DNA replication and repair protein RecF
VAGRLAKDHVSRGQQKLLAAALLIAQIRRFPVERGTPVLLLDDPSAELDSSRLCKLIEHVAGGEHQLVVTTLHESFSAFGTPGVSLRLESGSVRAG